MYSFKYLKSVLLIVFSALFVVSCSSDDDENNMVTPTPTITKVRVIHTSYDAPAVDIRVDGAVAIPNLAYGETSGYAEVSSGTRNIQVTPAGAATPVVINANLPLEANREYTVYAVGQLASIDAVVSEDSRSPNSSKAKVRFLHAAPDAPAVDIKVNSGTGLAVFTNAAFKDVTSYIEVDAGDYKFVVTPAGATDEVFVFDPITVENGKVYTVVAHGTLDNSDNIPFAVRVFIDINNGDTFADLTTAASNVSVTHASPDAPGVDLLVDNIVVNSSALTFPNSTGYLEINAGTRNIKVNASGTATTVINADLTLAANSSYSVFAVDFLSDIAPLVIEDNLTAPAAGKAHVRFLHLSPDAPAVDITLTDGTVVFGNNAFLDYTEFTPLDAGSYNLQVRVANTSNVVLSLPGLTFEEGMIYTVFAKGSVNGSGAQALDAQIITNN